ncbi:hypothetical protein [Sphingobium yanoikuyae]|uniref:Uncharacterized protein n=1 Tax=Sphingobium yanoikuyae TaxID=13690 RepID=A0A9X7UFC9_SPHYA|nr:hypothetical protein [Sphingobium yanoikuyae]QNG47389.1 hypothetical protein H3V42_07205 [Sphingobium yanoikuyae]
MSRALYVVLEGLKDVQEVFDMDDRLFEANEAGMTMLIEQDQLLRDILAAQMVAPYNGWSIGKLNKAVERARSYLVLPSVHDLNPDIKAMVEGVQLANLVCSAGSAGWPRGDDGPDVTPADVEEAPPSRWPVWLPRIGILPSMTVGLGRDDDEFDGRVLVIQWGRFVFEMFMGKCA